MKIVLAKFTGESSSILSSKFITTIKCLKFIKLLHDKSVFFHRLKSVNHIKQKFLYRYGEIILVLHSVACAASSNIPSPSRHNDDSIFETWKRLKNDSVKEFQLFFITIGQKSATIEWFETIKQWSRNNNHHEMQSLWHWEKNLVVL